MEKKIVKRSDVATDRCRGREIYLFLNVLGNISLFRNTDIVEDESVNATILFIVE